MITQNTIDKVLDNADIAKVIGAKVELKKSGSNYTGKCPFHTEKSGSFVVSPVKDIYKCFGCGAGGNVINFVMEHERMDFVEAIRELAKDLGIDVEETEDREDKEIREKRAVMIDVNKDVTKRYQESLLDLKADHWAVDMIIDKRQLSNDSIVDFKIGYAPDGWSFVSKKLIDSGLYGIGEELGVIGRSDGGQTYDVFRDRIIFPIQNVRGDVIAFSGRKGLSEKDKGPKYINSKDSIVYRKSGVLYGLYQAQKSIRKMDHAILVEGNVDVIMMHQGGATNTVGTCGTAFTESQAQVLAKYCSRVTVMFDGDDAGYSATMKAVDILLMVGLGVNVVMLDKGDDPDTVVQGLLAPVSIPVKNDKTIKRKSKKVVEKAA